MFYHRSVLYSHNMCLTEAWVLLKSGTCPANQYTAKIIQCDAVQHMYACYQYIHNSSYLGWYYIILNWTKIMSRSLILILGLRLCTAPLSGMILSLFYQTKYYILRKFPGKIILSSFKLFCLVHESHKLTNMRKINSW